VSRRGEIVKNAQYVTAGVVLMAAAIGWSPDGRRSDFVQEPVSDTAMSETMDSILNASGAPLRHAADTRMMRAALAALYSPTAMPVWADHGRPTSGANTAVALLTHADDEGLVPEDYDAAWLTQQQVGLTANPATTTQLALFDVSLSTELLRYLQAVHQGRVRPPEVGFAYHHDIEGTDLGERLRLALAAGCVEKLAAELEPRFAQYARLKRTLAEYRRTDGRGPRSRVRQIELALERLRWLPHAPDGKFLVANVPAFRLVAFRSATDERPALQTAIVVGRAARTQTPVFADELTHVLFRPCWYPPPSIIRNEILPALARSAAYLQRERMDIVAVTDDSSPALPVTAQNLQLLGSGRLALRQRPGPHNALGLVKFVFPNDYRVYMHDTPARSLFERERRDFSHGCIRVKDPARLAEFVLSEAPGWTAARIAAAMNGTRTTRADVVPPIPVFIFYTTAIVRADDTLEFFDDIYGLDALLDRALTAAGRR
jgi:murein L,D-transpeptidase YcbB/YkuD